MSKQTCKLMLLGLIALAALVIGIGIGSVAVAPDQLIAVLSNKLWGAPLPQEMPAVLPGLVWNIRLPRVLLAFFVGAALSVSGTVMQSLLQNPLASSYGLGVSAGAGLAVAVCMVVGLTESTTSSWFLLPLICLAAGLGTMVLVLSISQSVDQGFSNQTIVLIGMVISLFLSALMSTLANAAPDYTQRIMSWQLGSFSMKTWAQLAPVVPITVACCLVLWRYSHELDLLSFGDQQAAALGLEHRRIKWLSVVLVAMLTGTAVAFVGIIGFVDLVAPHIVRRLFGPAHRLLIPGCALFGGAFMVLCDLAARTLISPSEIPIGSITALLGAPFFLYIYFASRKKV